MKMEPVHPGDLEDLLKSAFAAGLNMSQSQLEGVNLAAFKDYVKRPAPVSTHQRVAHALERSVITDEMIERAAKALEKAQKAGYEWTEEQFEIWWNHDPYFVERIQGWGDFRGTMKDRCIWEARTILEAALQEMTP